VRLIKDMARSIPSFPIIYDDHRQKNPLRRVKVRMPAQQSVDFLHLGDERPASRRERFDMFLPHLT
jgi:hypothetical protein